MNSLRSVFAATLCALLLAGCAHEPLPRLAYRAATPLGPAPCVPTSVAFEAGQAVGHSLTSYALLPGGYMMPIASGPSPTGAFNTDDQAAFVQNLARVLTERGVIQLAGDETKPEATLAVKFLKTEHFPDMQDYILDVLVTARRGEKSYERVHHVSTIDEVNLVARMFQHGIDGRRRAAEMLLTAVVSDLETWFTSRKSGDSMSAGALHVFRPFESCTKEIIDFLRARYARPSTFWKDGISVQAGLPSESVAVIELRWSNADSVPPFCSVDVYADGEGTRIVVRERDPLLASRVGVREAMEEFARAKPAAIPTAHSAESAN